MTVSILRFLGSNCDRDCLHVFKHTLKQECKFVWHGEHELPPETKAVVIPGGFSHGDYLRCGAMAAHRPVMNSVRRFVENGGPVLGICNGFQILCESNLLPGALLVNRHGRFACRVEKLEVAENQGALKGFAKGEKLNLPVAHFAGSYFVDEVEYNTLKKNNRIALSYTRIGDDGCALVNGSLFGVAGVFGGPNNNVLGLMPHPERHSSSTLGGEDGLKILKGLLS